MNNETIVKKAKVTQHKCDYCGGFDIENKEGEELCAETNVAFHLEDRTTNEKREVCIRYLIKLFDTVLEESTYGEAKEMKCSYLSCKHESDLNYLGKEICYHHWFKYADDDYGNSDRLKRLFRVR